jgi:hypothetical protein
LERSDRNKEKPAEGGWLFTQRFLSSIFYLFPGVAATPLLFRRCCFGLLSYFSPCGVPCHDLLGGPPACQPGFVSVTELETRTLIFDTLSRALSLPRLLAGHPVYYSSVSIRCGCARRFKLAERGDFGCSAPWLPLGLRKRKRLRIGKRTYPGPRRLRERIGL